MDTMTETDQNAMVSMAVGILTPEQAAAQIPFGSSAGGNPVLWLKRLICRGGLPASRVSGQIRVSVEALHDFLANGPTNAAALKSLGLPAETLVPLFPLQGDTYGPVAGWDWPMEAMTAAFIAEVGTQLPPWDDVAAMLRGADLESAGMVWRKYNQMPDLIREGGMGEGAAAAWLDRAKMVQATMAKLAKQKPMRGGDSLTLEADITPAMKLILQRPFSTGGTFLKPANPEVFHYPDGSMFLNLGELWCVRRIQQGVCQILRGMSGLSSGAALYDSEEFYQRITDQALAQRPQFMVEMKVCFKPQGQPIGQAMDSSLTLALTDAQVMAAAGTNAGRICRLAF
jgi:hypothetical protein